MFDAAIDTGARGNLSATDQHPAEHLPGITGSPCVGCKHVKRDRETWPACVECPDLAALHAVYLPVEKPMQRAWIMTKQERYDGLGECPACKRRKSQDAFIGKRGQICSTCSGCRERVAKKVMEKYNGRKGK